MPHQRVRNGPLKDRPCRKRAAVIAIAAFALSSPALAAEPVSYAVRARVTAAEAAIHGTVQAQVRVAAGEREVRFWLLPDRLAVRPSVLDEINARWIFPGEVDLGSIEIQSARVEGLDQTGRTERSAPGTERGQDFGGSDLLLPVVAGEARVIEVEIDFLVRLPQRFGRLGEVGDTVSLTAPWYPLVVGEGDTWRYHVPHRVVVNVDAPRDVVIGGTVTPRGVPVVVDGAFAPVMLAPTLHRWVGRGGRLQVLAPYRLHRPAPADAEGIERIEDLLALDRVARIENALSDVVATMGQVGLGAAAERPLTVAFVPSRTELAAHAPGMVLVSDRLFEVFPIELTEEFHARALRRALFRALLSPTVDSVEVPQDRAWSEDLRAAFLGDVDVARRDGEVRSPRELIGFAAFHPSVDSLLYAPQIAFVGAYFGSSVDPYRDAPESARVPMTSGRRFLEAARAALEPEAFARFGERLASGQVAVRQALAEADPALPVNEWLTLSRNPVNYRLGEVQSEPVANGRFRHRAIIFRDGSTRREPVPVKFVDDEGASVVVVWDESGSQGAAEWESSAELDHVEIDPEGQLWQSAEVADGHPRADDATSHPFRPPLLRAFGLNVLVSEGQVTGFVDFALRRQYNVDNTWATTLRVSTAAYSGSVRYIQGFGPKRTTNSRVGFVSGGLGAARLRSDFADDVEGGWRLSAVGSAGFDTRFYQPDPRSGQSLVLSGRAGPVFRDDGGTRVSGALGLRGSLTLALGLKNALVFVGSAGWTFGEALPGENQALGGRFGLRAFETTELVGRLAAYGVVEHRWTAFSDLEWNILHLAWLREIQLAVFGGGGVVVNSILDGATLGASEVGVGVRLHFEYGGVQPGVLAFDVALPLTRGQGTIGSDGVRGSERLPFGLHASFDQYF